MRTTDDFTPRCRWDENDRCQHGARIDDQTTRWNPMTRRHQCDAIYAAQEARTA